jgi:transcriptional regulator with XRE-family HTH domain
VAVDTGTLASLLRSWRQRLSPADVGIVSVGRRRTEGLRREEIAQLAGISVDYVVRLEQGRSRTPSAQVVASLSRALQLSRTETTLLHRAAGLTPPGVGIVSHHIPRGVQRIISRLPDLPLAVFAADWTLLASTGLWRQLFGALHVVVEPGQNLVVQTFREGTVAAAATPDEGPEQFEEALVADLRRVSAELRGDHELATMVADLRAHSPRFARYWDAGRAATHETLVKTIHHPVVGDLRLDCDVLQAPDSDIKLVVYTTSATGPDAEKLEFLRVGAVQAQFTEQS